VEPGPLYALPTVALFATVLAAVPLGIARHAIDILLDLTATKIASRSRQTLREDATMQANLGQAEALVVPGGRFWGENCYSRLTEDRPLDFRKPICPYRRIPSNKYSGL
jgi:hypothetical protein